MRAFTTKQENQQKERNKMEFPYSKILGPTLICLRSGHLLVPTRKSFHFLCFRSSYPTESNV
ncbi:hypothetical protein LBK6_02755 [Leptospira borgpetersenii serovar Hardjo]|nr:hypothetical protein LBK6_02755 [Leptospira borgpetersenii serovar Hardjo]AWV69237.1 hypothetical protein B9T54_02930 [Leptospira borgpetersenii serovar Hardjo-bovis]TQE50776.1 hypothetical protein FFZ95_17340 [Leptospira borgpetersenii]AMX60565.1 hypothetical protein LBK9_02695 [Leptospira borgpetersenii serovar Hardjo]AMX63811.1 hypothetical protein LBK30_02755 [Leptospira borgpetersenii serovar Hardjo]